jgi:N-methylhydantoinase B
MSNDTFFMTADDVERRFGIDLITGETIRNSLIESTRQMWRTLLRSSFSNIIRDAMDFGVCVHVVQDDGTTEMVAITEGCTQFAFTHQHMTNMVLDEYGIENLGPGDTLVCNDAFRGGIHFGDLNFFRVIHDEDGKPAFVVSDAAHVFDIGGPVAGGFNNTASTMYEEGLRLPPTLITASDRPVRSTLNLLLENTRSPLHMLGDVRALLGTLRAGEQGVRHLMERFGTPQVQSGARYALDLAERRMRHALLAVPDGEWSSKVTFDDDGIGTEPVTVRAKLRIHGANAEIDFSGTDPQSLGSITTGWQEAGRAIIGPKVLLDPRHPMNAGAMRPFDVLLPAGSMVLALPPTSQSGHSEMGAKIARLMIGLLAKACPDRAVAEDSGTSGAIIVHGMDTRPGLVGQPFGQALIFGEAWGGTAETDGVSFCLSPLYNCRSNIIEYTEKAVPVVIWEYGMCIDSAGAGKHRGGFAGVLQFEALSETFATPIIDAARFSPRGTAGGTGGATTIGMFVAKDAGGSVRSWNGTLPAERLTPMFGRFDASGRPDPVDGTWSADALFQTTKPTAVPIAPGQVMRVHTACPGGWGDPRERDVERVQRDVADERISLVQAAEVYGVVLDPDTLKVDADETARRRATGDAPTVPSFFRAWPVTQEDFDALLCAPIPGSRQVTEV